MGKEAWGKERRSGERADGGLEELTSGFHRESLSSKIDRNGELVKEDKTGARGHNPKTEPPTPFVPKTELLPFIPAGKQ